jgi:hypothetical protein
MNNNEYLASTIYYSNNKKERKLLRDFFNKTDNEIINMYVKLCLYGSNMDFLFNSSKKEPTLKIIGDYGTDNYKEEWTLNGKFHRENGPSITRGIPGTDGYAEYWYMNGLLHNENGPAIIMGIPNTDKYIELWYMNGMAHNENGPAVVEGRHGTNKYKEKYFYFGIYSPEKIIYSNKEELFYKLYTNGVKIPEFQDDLNPFVFNPDFHKKEHDIIKTTDPDLAHLLHAWIYQDYAPFNRQIDHFNKLKENRYLTYRDEKFFGNIKNFDEAYRRIRNAIFSFPRYGKITDPPLMVYRGVHGMDDICQSATTGRLIGFSRITACSTIMNVSLRFARDGVLFLIELPRNTPFINLLPIKRSEPEIILPDRCVFRVVNRIQDKIEEFNKDYYMEYDTEFNIKCKEIIHLRLIGIVDTSLLHYEEEFSEHKIWKPSKQTSFKYSKSPYLSSVLWY